MTSVDFIEQLQTKLGGKIFEARNVSKQLRILEPSFPALATDYKGYHCYYNFVIEEELKVAVFKPPPHRMEITPAIWYRKLLKSVGLMVDIKSGIAYFDRIFMIQDIPKPYIVKTLNAEILDAIESFRPFRSFSMTLTKYEILKEVLLNKSYTIDQAIGDLDYLIRLVTKIENIYKKN